MKFNSDYHYPYPCDTVRLETHCCDFHEIAALTQIRSETTEVVSTIQSEINSECHSTTALTEAKHNRRLQQAAGAAERVLIDAHCVTLNPRHIHVRSVA